MTAELAEPASKIELPAGVGGGGEIPSFDVTLRVRRYNPEVSEDATWDDFKVTMYGTDRVLDALHKIKWEIDGSVSFRRSCAHGVCGSDAMRINGRNRLACKTLLKDLDTSKPIIVEPIKGLPVEKDLIVDMEPFFQSFREVMPFLINKGHEPTKERLQSAEDRERFDDTTKCILCAACTSSCPVFWTDGQYFGPAAIVNAHRFIFDSRDDAGDMRLEILNDKEGVWRCRTTFNCSEACPRGIQVTQAIAEVKQAIPSREEPLVTRNGIGDDYFATAGRWVEADFRLTDAGGNPVQLTVASAYVHSGDVGTPKQVDKYRFLDAMSTRLPELTKHSDHALVVGDLNVGHTERDIRNWKGNVKKAGFLPDERAYFDHFFGEDIGWKDVHRGLAGDVDGPYTWWSQRGQAFDNDTGWRIDYHLATPDLAAAAFSAVVDRAPSWDTRFSDHAPLVVDYRL